LKEFRDIEPAKGGHAFDQGRSDAPHPGEFERRRGGVVRQPHGDCIRAVAGDLTGERFHRAGDLGA
jgi:hypothetical protein